MHWESPPKNARMKPSGKKELISGRARRTRQRPDYQSSALPGVYLSNALSVVIAFCAAGLSSGLSFAWLTTTASMKGVWISDNGLATWRRSVAGGVILCLSFAVAYLLSRVKGWLIYLVATSPSRPILAGLTLAVGSTIMIDVASLASRKTGGISEAIFLAAGQAIVIQAAIYILTGKKPQGSRLGLLVWAIASLCASSLLTFLLAYSHTATEMIKYALLNVTLGLGASAGLVTTSDWVVITEVAGVADEVRAGHQGGPRA